MPDSPQTPPKLLKTQVYASIRDVPAEAWDSLGQKHSATFSRPFWEVLENAGINDFKYRYAVFFAEDGSPAGLAGFYSVTTDLATFGPPALRRLLAGVRRVFPGFLKLPMLECGTPVTLNSPPYIVADGAREEDVILSLDALLTAEARAGGKFLVVVRDFEPQHAASADAFRARGYHCVDGLPNTYLDIRWKTAEEFLSAMKSYFRSKALKHLKRNESRQVDCRRTDDFSGMAEELCRQWMVVHRNASTFQREVLTPAFYRELPARMGGDAAVLLFSVRERPIGHALLLKDGKMVRWLYCGRNDSSNDSFYIYICYKVIEAAIAMGATRLEMGLTTYPVKQDMGAEMVPMRIALRCPYKFIHPLVGFFYPLLNSTPRISSRDVFKPAKNAAQP